MVDINKSDINNNNHSFVFDEYVDKISSIQKEIETSSKERNDNLQQEINKISDFPINQILRKLLVPWKRQSLLSINKLPLFMICS